MDMRDIPGVAFVDDESAARTLVHVGQTGIPAKGAETAASAAIRALAHRVWTARCVHWLRFFRSGDSVKAASLWDDFYRYGHFTDNGPCAACSEPCEPKRWKFLATVSVSTQEMDTWAAMDTEALMRVLTPAARLRVGRNVRDGLEADKPVFVKVD